MAEYAWQKDPVTGRETYRKVHRPDPNARNTKRLAFIRDDCDVKSMVDGKRYTSKAALRASYKREGFIEAGGCKVDDFVQPRPEPDRRRIRDAIERACGRTGIN